MAKKKINNNEFLGKNKSKCTHWHPHVRSFHRKLIKLCRFFKTWCLEFEKYSDLAMMLEERFNDNFFRTIEILEKERLIIKYSKDGVYYIDVLPF